MSERKVALALIPAHKSTPAGPAHEDRLAREVIRRCSSNSDSPAESSTEKRIAAAAHLQSPRHISQTVSPHSEPRILLVHALLPPSNGANALLNGVFASRLAATQAARAGPAALRFNPPGPYTGLQPRIPPALPAQVDWPRAGCHGVWGASGHRQPVPGPEEGAAGPRSPAATRTATSLSAPISSSRTQTEQPDRCEPARAGWCGRRKTRPAGESKQAAAGGAEGAGEGIAVGGPAAACWRVGWR
jgi:hypothetical protein